ncbi:MAG TPA: glutathione transferase GstA [Gammaproteobacteria bacterium]|jgi:glutathione S-transferase|nr:glutathione transferase GstA [Gammaproteobacteria bacterium]
MKLYYAKGACSLVCRIVINEVKLPCEYESVDLRTKKTETGQDFFKINPKGSVPTLQVDEKEILTENAVIVQFLAEKAHAVSLLPPVGEFKRYHVLEWLNYVATEWHKGVGSLFNAQYPAEVKETVLIPAITKKVQFVNHHLEQHRYLFGEQFTLPDAYLFVMMTWLVHFKFDLAQYPALERYFKELLQHPSVKISLEQEGLG